ncbi:MAG TPA: hypothetical protein VG078_04650 [Acidimicrobiales bacterium]|nr:hypothetical protein [Acidimicrobiales bacterium]
MPTALETTTAIQDKVFAGIEASQKAVVDYVRAWAETVETTFSKLPELATAEPLKPSQVLETTLGFTEKVVASQREFASRLFEAALPATQVATRATSQAATQAAKVSTPKG